jgi:uncharacterized protein YndB with AHSA1/START domain
MPEFEQCVRSDAPPEDVWKLLYDPSRFPEWWAGIGSVEPGQDGEYTMYPQGYPDFPMGQRLRVTESGVTISCLVSDLVFEWRLAALDDGAATSITVHVEIPEAEAHRLAAQQDVVSQSLSRLAALAAEGSRLAVARSPSRSPDENSEETEILLIAAVQHGWLASRRDTFGAVRGSRWLAGLAGRVPAKCVPAGP